MYIPWKVRIFAIGARRIVYIDPLRAYLPIQRLKPLSIHNIYQKAFPISNISGQWLKAARERSDAAAMHYLQMRRSERRTLFRLTRLRLTKNIFRAHSLSRSVHSNSPTCFSSSLQPPTKIRYWAIFFKCSPLSCTRHQDHVIRLIPSVIQYELNEFQ